MPCVTSLSTSGSRPRSPRDSTTSGYESRPHPPSRSCWIAAPAVPGRGESAGWRRCRPWSSACTFGPSPCGPATSAPEAPTHLRAGDLPPGLLDDIDPTDQRSAAERASTLSVVRAVDPAARRARSAAGTADRTTVAEPRSVVSVSLSHSLLEAAPRVRTEPGSVITAAGAPPEEHAAVRHGGARTADPHPTARSADPHPTARPADPHPTARPADPHPTARPADPQPHSPLSRPAPPGPPQQTRTPQPAQAAPVAQPRAAGTPGAGHAGHRRASIRWRSRPRPSSRAPSIATSAASRCRRISRARIACCATRSPS